MTKSQSYQRADRLVRGIVGKFSAVDDRENRLPLVFAELVVLAARCTDDGSLGGNRRLSRAASSASCGKVVANICDGARTRKRNDFQSLV